MPYENIQQYDCPKCGEKHQEDIARGHRTDCLEFCESCRPQAKLDVAEEERLRRMRHLQKQWDGDTRQWDTPGICPPLYRATDMKDPRLAKQLVQAVADWDPASKIGLGFIGTTGKGKTRCLWSALHKAHMAGRNVKAVSHVEFRRIVLASCTGDSQDRENASDALKRLLKADVLLFDELGKAPSTEAVDAEFSELVERRAANELPILWSSNGADAWLVARFGEDRGEPIVRRLAEFTTVIDAG